MRGILGRINTGPSRLSEADRKRLLLVAVVLHREGRRSSEIEAELERLGAPHHDARTLCGEAALQFSSEVAKHVPLPASASSAVNYYFALGVTPRASGERIRRAFRMRAREVHPDRHNQELNRDLWSQLMTIASDAHQVLSDEQTRRAYDVFWLKRSRRVTAQWSSPKERRGDWETRYHWYMAEVAEIEDNLELMMSDTRERLESGEVLGECLSALLTATDLYEERILQVRTDALMVPGPHRRLAERARLELVRKDRLVAELQALTAALPEGQYSVAERLAALHRLTPAEETRATVREAHRRFEVEALRQAAA